MAIIRCEETLIGKYPSKTKKLAIEVAKKAIEKAGNRKEEIDCGIATHSFGDPEYTAESNLGVISTELGIYPKFHTHLIAEGQPPAMASRW